MWSSLGLFIQPSSYCWHEVNESAASRGAILSRRINSFIHRRLNSSTERVVVLIFPEGFKVSDSICSGAWWPSPHFTLSRSKWTSVNTLKNLRSEHQFCQNESLEWFTDSLITQENHTPKPLRCVLVRSLWEWITAWWFNYGLKQNLQIG